MNKILRVRDLCTGADFAVLSWESISESGSNEIWQNFLYSPEIEIDFSDVDYVSHDGLAWIAFILIFRWKHGTISYLNMADNERVNYSLIKMGLLEICQLTGTYILNKYKIRNSSIKVSGKLDKINLIIGGNYSQIINEISFTLPEFVSSAIENNPSKFNIDQFVHDFSTTVKEYIINVALHSSQNNDSLGLCSFSPPKDKYAVFKFCCLDTGRGIKKALEEDHNIFTGSHLEAIYEGVLLRFHHSDEGILGIFRTLEYIHKRFGSIHIRTGNSLCIIDFRNHNSRQEEFFQNPSVNRLAGISSTSNDLFHISGTQIMLTLKRK